MMQNLSDKLCDYQESNQLNETPLNIMKTPEELRKVIDFKINSAPASDDDIFEQVDKVLQ